LLAALGNDINGIHWTDLSENVPSKIENLPFILFYIAGGKES
jgi:hypothetical protein